MRKIIKNISLFGQIARERWSVCSRVHIALWSTSYMESKNIIYHVYIYTEKLLDKVVSYAQTLTTTADDIVQIIDDTHRENCVLLNSVQPSDLFTLLKKFTELINFYYSLLSHINSLKTEAVII